LECATKIIPIAAKKQIADPIRAESKAVLANIVIQAPEVNLTGGTPATDIFLVGNLLNTLVTPIDLSEKARQFRDLLTNNDPTQRPSIAQALTHSFLQ
jgi:hypothetical protein